MLWLIQLFLNSNWLFVKSNNWLCQKKHMQSNQKLTVKKVNTWCVVQQDIFLGLTNHVSSKIFLLILRCNFLPIDRLNTYFFTTLSQFKMKIELLIADIYYLPVIRLKLYLSKLKKFVYLKKKKSNFLFTITKHWNITMYVYYLLCTCIIYL